MELEWSDLSLVLAICRSGSLSGAARLLGQNHSTIFRRINAIEERTGVRFFERLPQGYRMTAAGEAAFATAERVESEIHALGREILGQDMRLQGHVRVTAPEGVVANILPEVVIAFSGLHPDVSIELLGSTAALDLSRREAEVAIRATRKPPDSAFGRKVCDFRFAIFGSPGYLQQHADLPLKDMQWCLLQGLLDWLVPSMWKKREQGEQQTALVTNSVVPLLNAVAGGLGVSVLPCYLGDADARLVRAAQPIETLTIELWVLTHSDLRHTARVKTLMSFLFEFLAARRDLFEGNLSQTCAG